MVDIGELAAEVAMQLNPLGWGRCWDVYCCADISEHAYPLQQVAIPGQGEHWAEHPIACVRPAGKHEGAGATTLTLDVRGGAKDRRKSRTC